MSAIRTNTCVCHMCVTHVHVCVIEREIDKLKDAGTKREIERDGERQRETEREVGRHREKRRKRERERER